MFLKDSTVIDMLRSIQKLSTTDLKKNLNFLYLRKILNVGLLRSDIIQMLSHQCISHALATNKVRYDRQNHNA